QIQETGTADGIEAGFNTDWRGTPPDPKTVLDTDNSPVHNHSITFADLSVVSYNGKTYYEFHLDINESQDKDAAQITLESLQVFKQTATGDAAIDGMLHDYNATNGTLTGASEIYNLDGGADGLTGGGDDSPASISLEAWASG